MVGKIKRVTVPASGLEARFHQAMLAVYETWKRDCNYRANRFLQLVTSHGGLEGAKRLLKRPGPSLGLLTLADCKRLDLSVEACVLKPDFRSLFTAAELEKARTRLAELGYPRRR
jgi:hypothetical protein